MLMSNNKQTQRTIQLSSVDQMLRAPVSGEYINLEPLTKDHAEEYFRQYHNTDIQQMTDLPLFTSACEVSKWIEEDSVSTNTYNYAILVPVIGFAGFVNLIVSEHAAFFGIWLGEKFQGIGLGTQAGQLICQHAFDAKLSVVFTAAFKTNYRSIQMLKKVGFETLPISAFDPYSDRAFFILTHDPAIKKNGNTELINYYQREQLPHRFYAST
jgi:RimJ/RimL family protein N-acetyltransferase